MEFEKTKPIISYCVLRDAYSVRSPKDCEKEFEKTNPISRPLAGNPKQIRSSLCPLWSLWLTEVEKTKPISEACTDGKQGKSQK